jgi:hypothetical protein
LFPSGSADDRATLDHADDRAFHLRFAAVSQAQSFVEEALTRGGLDEESVLRNPHTGETFTLRWILVHMIEEYSRHNGHADLIRESIDGQTG